MRKTKLKIAVISGSQRANSNSLKVSRLICNLLTKKKLNSYLISLEEEPLPFWNEDIDTSESPSNRAWTPIKKELRECEGLVIVTPEWNGTATPALKNFLQYCGLDEVGHKPGLIVSITTGLSGTYPITDIKLSTNKNNRLCFLPENMVIKNVHKFLDDIDGCTSPITKDLLSRLEYCLTLLQGYSEALTSLRAKNIINKVDFKNGL